MDIVDWLKEYHIIYEKDEKYYSSCEKGEEITIEINRIKNKFKESD